MTDALRSTYTRFGINPKDEVISGDPYLMGWYWRAVKEYEPNANACHEDAEHLVRVRRDLDPDLIRMGYLDCKGDYEWAGSK